MPLQAKTQMDFSGGMNTVTNPFAIRKNQVISAINLILDEHGSLRVRDGTLKRGVQNPTPTNPIVKLYDFNTVISGFLTTFQLAITNNAGGNILYIRNANPWTVVHTFTSGYVVPDILTFTNLAICAPGNSEVLGSYDGTTYANLTGAPNGAHLANHLNYLWVGNTAAVTNYGTLVGPSSLQMSAIVNPNSWPPANQTWISPDDGQSIQCLTLFTVAESGISPTAALVIWKDFSGYEATGVLGTSTFAVQRIKSDMGCVASRTAQFISGFGIIRLTHRGFGLYDGVNDELISEEVRPYIFGRDTYTGIDWTNVNRCYAAQVANPPLYVCACPTSGSNGSLTRFFIYDLIRRSWTIGTYANAVSTLQLLLDPNQLPVMVGGDSSAGYVRQYFAGDTTDDGVSINWTLIPAPLFGPAPMQNNYLRRFLLSVYGFTAGTSITATFSWAANSVNSTHLVPTIASTQSFLGYGAQPFGDAGYGDVQPNPTVPGNDITMEFVPLGGILSNWILLTLSGIGPGKIRAASWQHIPKPLTRSVTSVTQR